MDEIWKDVVGYEGLYQVSSIGRVKSMLRFTTSKGGKRIVNERILKSGFSPCGYPMVVLRKNNTPKTKTIHRMMAIAFLGQAIKYELLVVDHINGDRADNNIANLRFVTHRFNSTDGFRSDADKLASKYRGIFWNKSANKWAARIRIGTDRKHLGLFDSEIEAHNAYLSAAENVDDYKFN